MAITLKELYENMQSKYNLQLLSGKDALEYMVTWAHMMEDPSVIKFFWGNELSVSSGYAIHSEDELLHLIDVLIEHHSIGLVLNIGMYIPEVSQKVVEYCQNRSFPLFTMPWRMSMTEFVRDCCSYINRSTWHEEELANLITNIIHSPQDIDRARDHLSEHFQEELGFTALVIWVEVPSSVRNRLGHQSTLRFHTAMHPYSFSYLIFRMDRRFVILMNQTDITIAAEIASRVLSLVHESIPEISINIGISSTAPSLNEVPDCYNQALSAQRRAVLQQLPIVKFQDMGFYKLIYSIPDESLLEDYYREMLGPLLEFDANHNANYTETLCRYLLLDGSLQSVASAMFTHRNTVNYRMGKIRELLNCSFETQSQRLPYLIAYHSAVVLKLLPDYESD